MVENSIGTPYPRPNRRPATTPAAQLEIAAQWLHEAALALKDGDTYLRLNTERVAGECEAMARKMGRV